MQLNLITITDRIFVCETSYMGYCKFVVIFWGERGFGEEIIELLFKFLVLRSWFTTALIAKGFKDS